MAGKKKDVIFNFFEQLLMQIAMSRARNISNKTHLPVPDLLPVYFSLLTQHSDQNLHIWINLKLGWYLMKY